MHAGELMDMVRKRYDGKAWIVIEEVGNATGSRVARHADAIALGIWPSHGHRIEGIETKVSREDVKKELRDPSKADAVGRFCDHWWLVISDLSIIDGLVLPPTWGVLFPKGGVLRVHRKAPQLKAKQIDRGFSAAMIRKVVEDWMPRGEHLEYVKDQEAKARKKIEEERAHQQIDMNFELEQLKRKIEIFKTKTGIDVAGEYEWRFGRVADAVNAIIEAGEQGGDHLRGPNRKVDVVSIIRQKAASLRFEAEDHARAQRTMISFADGVEAVAKRFEERQPIEPEEAAAWAKAAGTAAE